MTFYVTRCRFALVIEKCLGGGTVLWTQCICQYMFSSVQSSLSGHKNIIRYIDSSITVAPNGVHEVLLLMQYYRSKQQSKSKWNSNFLSVSHVSTFHFCNIFFLFLNTFHLDICKCGSKCCLAASSKLFYNITFRLCCLYLYMPTFLLELVIHVSFIAIMLWSQFV